MEFVKKVEYKPVIKAFLTIFFKKENSDTAILSLFRKRSGSKIIRISGVRFKCCKSLTPTLENNKLLGNVRGILMTKWR